MSSTPILTGIHHVTMIAGDAQANVDFYAGVLGLRLVKQTVNYDDPGTYHLYYGDALGRPGTILTFFPWPGARRGRPGLGQVTHIQLAVPAGSLEFWARRLDEHGLDTEGSNRGIGFEDPDGLSLALVAVQTQGDGGGSGTVPAEYAIRGVHGIVLGAERAEPSRTFLTQVLNFSTEGQEHNAGNAHLFVDATGLEKGLSGAGTVHHVAFRTPDDAQQQAWLEKLIGAGYHVSPVRDRQYFHSIYFREPGGVLFEIATDPPGFGADGETPDTLGTRLQLPNWLEKDRTDIERRLPPLRLPGETNPTNTTNGAA